MTVLITRAAPGSEETLRRLRARGIGAIASPVLETAPVAAPEPDWSGVQAVLITSANGARAMAPFGAAKPLRVLAVGDGTRAALLEAGYRNVVSADGGAAELAALARASLRPDGGEIIHAGGADLALDLAQILSGEGFRARRLTIYETRPAAALSPEALVLLRGGAAAGVLLHSKQGAEAFLNLARAAALAPFLTKIRAICLSARIEAALDPAAWRSIKVAAKPNEEALLALIAQDA